MSLRARLVAALVLIGGGGVVTAVALVPQGTSPAVAMFRGDARHSGVYPAPPGSEYAGLRWRVQTGGPVRSSPAVVGNSVYVGSNDGAIYAIDRTTGRVRWRHEVAGPASSSPAVDGDMVYVTTRAGCLALDAASGKERFTVVAGRELPFPWGHESGDRYLSSPALMGDLLIFGAGDGVLRAADRRTGKLRWSFATHALLRSSPAVGDSLVVIGGADGTVYAVDPASGRLRWHFNTAGHDLVSANFGFDRRTIQSSPAIGGGVVVVGARDGFIYALAEADGHQLWQVDHHISWINTSPAIDGSLVVVGSSDAHFTQGLDLTTGKERWQAPAANIVWASAAIAGTTVFSADGSGNLFAIDRDSGAIRWTWTAGGGIFSSPVVADSTAYFGSDDGGIYALGLGSAPLARAVFWDTTLVDRGFFRGQDPVRGWLTRRGYTAIDKGTLGAWLASHSNAGGRSVVVFALDVLPDADTVAFRRYLESGGKVIWLGVPPALWPRHPDGGLDLKDVDRPAAQALLGANFGPGNFDPQGATPTDAGVRWGLTDWQTSNWGVAPGSVSEILARDDDGLAAAWVRRWRGPEGTGFVRLYGPDWGGGSGRIPTALSVQVAAEYFPR